ncbi:hypothetical protein [Streptomyces sp. NPDC091268]|uniref:hypothetical protein n=1 Tax=Streptomyces sp. NPDC091268 TaxID=3365979 RepID=UPI00381ADA8A
MALAATVPYLLLKTAWLSGSRIGIPEGSALREVGPFLTAANAVTLAMDASVILLVLVVTRPWGRRVPSMLLTVPAFVATGLLSPILIGFPGQLLIRALGFGAGGSAGVERAAFLEPWVFTVVYTGFTLQGLALAALFVPYVRERWGQRWRDAARERLPLPTGVVAGAAVAVGLAVGATYLYWAFGGSTGMAAERAAASSAETGLISAVHGACALAAGAGALLQARGGRGRWPLALGWTGSAAALCWGLFALITALGPQLDGGEAPPPAALLAYAGQMITGCLGAFVLIRSLASTREG